MVDGATGEDIDEIVRETLRRRSPGGYRPSPAIGVWHAPRELLALIASYRDADLPSKVERET
jgi:hypothetical protein